MKKVEQAIEKHYSHFGSLAYVTFIRDAARFTGDRDETENENKTVQELLNEFANHILLHGGF